MSITNKIQESNSPKVNHWGTPDAIFKEEKIREIGQPYW